MITKTCVPLETRYVIERTTNHGITYFGLSEYADWHEDLNDKSVEIFATIEGARSDMDFHCRRDAVSRFRVAPVNYAFHISLQENDVLPERSSPIDLLKL